MKRPPPARNDTELVLSPAMEDYLKSIFRLGERIQPVTTQALAEHLGVAPASVTSMVKRLAERRLLSYERYRGVELTESGRRVAQEMIRHHRLLELYLTQSLGFSQDQVHAEAERLEHVISELFEERIDHILGRPTCDPHGSPIPARSGQVPCPGPNSLDSVELFVGLRVLQAPEHLGSLGLIGGAEISVLGRPPGALCHLRVEQVELLLDPEICRQILVERRSCPGL